MNSCTDQFELEVERFSTFVLEDIYKLFLEELVNVIYDLFFELLQRICGIYVYSYIYRVYKKK